MQIEVQIKRLNSEVPMPSYATDGSAGIDLVASEAICLKKGAIAFVPTGLSVAFPKEYAALLYARSGLASKHGITMANGVGVIDSDYRGELKCPMINLGEADYQIHKGDRIGQLIFTPVAHAHLTEVQVLDETARGTGGFGSTGR
jgi:dUTP pyrophosphatase